MIEKQNIHSEIETNENLQKAGLFVTCSFVQTFEEKDIEGVRMVVDIVVATTLIACSCWAPK